MMSIWLRKLITAPVFEDEAKTRAARLLNIVLLIFLIVTAAFLFFFIFVLPNHVAVRYTVIVSLFIGIMCLGLLYLVNYGYVRIVSVLFSSSLLAVTILSVYLIKGIRNNTASFYLVVIAIAALLLGKRMAVVFGLLSILTVLGIYYAEIWGYVLYPMPTSVEALDWIMLCSALVVGTFLMHFAVDNIDRGFERARRNAQALAESNKELQASRDALAQQAQELARSNAELEQFAYMASHDLQEPLRMVIGYLKLLERDYKGRLDADADEFIAYAVDGAARMEALINDLLKYSRMDIQEKTFESIDCAEVLQVVLTNLQLSIEETGTKITSDDLPTLMADEVQLTQLFQNLISNAIKFRGEDPPEIHIGVEQLDRDSDDEAAHWLFSVCDNGIGIDPKQTERIFMIFQRLHTREEYQGTGIGLAMCKKIVERHGGRIWVESKPGNGSTFYFTIPDRVETL
jgi:signal transduction histidine kinase